MLPLLIYGQNGNLTATKAYETIEDKIVGIWPHENKLFSKEKFKEVKEVWGFNYVLIPAPYDKDVTSNAKFAGYDSVHIMKQIYLPDVAERPEWFWNNINELGKVWAYYFDEPISRNHSFIALLKILTELSNRGFYPHAKLIVSEIDEKKAGNIERFVDAIMYSGYGQRENMGLDQVNSWHEWREYIGDKFSMLWIGAHEDFNEYRTLLSAAKEKGYNSIWLYQYEPMEADKEIGNDNLEKFCDAAVEFGFMKIKKKD